MREPVTITWEKAARRAAFATLALIIAFAPAVMRPDLPAFYYRTQDAPAGILIAAALLLLAPSSPRWRFPVPTPSARGVAAGAALLVGLLWLGTHLVMLDYPLTRDEHMVVFDASNFAAGRIASTIPPQWLGYSLALVPNFLIITPDFAVLASSYLPGNAAMRAGISALADPALLNPLLAGIGLVVIHRIARRLFPGDAAAVWIVLAGYALSAQIAVNAMTAYAMTAHLVFNLIWLLLFLRGNFVAHAGAMVVGVFAIGLHQPIFHPLFAGPFILWLALQRRWLLFAAYGAVYAVAMMVWLSWLSIVAHSAGGVISEGSSAAGPIGFIVERVLPLVSRIDPRAPALMAANALRALTWNAAFILPLMIAAILARKRIGPVATCLLAGLALTLLAMTILLPAQGHGWGYRYIHGVLGSIILLAGFGWQVIAQRDGESRQGSVMALVLATVGIASMQMWQAHAFVARHAGLARMIESQQGDFVIVDTDTTGVAIDQVRNLPDLSNRPLVFASSELDDHQVAELCRKGRVITVGEQVFRKLDFFVESSGKTGPRFAAIERALAKGECYVPAR